MKNTYTLEQFEKYFGEWINNTMSKEDIDFDRAVRKYLGEKKYNEASMDGQIANRFLEKLVGDWRK